MAVIPEILNKTSVDEIFRQVEIDEALWFLSNFPSKTHPEEIISWLIYVGDKGMAPVIRRGTQSPNWKGDGLYEMMMRGALISEKIDFSEEDINKCQAKDPLRKQAAEYVILEKTEELANRNNRRTDWLASQIFFNNGIVSYRDKFGTVWNLDYQIPESHVVPDLGVNREWGTGSARTPLQDIKDMKRRIKLDSGGKVTKMFVNSRTITNRLFADEKIQALLQNNAFSVGPNLLTQTNEALSRYLDNTEIVEYDEYIPYSMNLVSRIDASNYIVDEPYILKPGTEVKFMRTDDTGLKLFQEELNVIANVNVVNGQITLETPLIKTFDQRDDKIRAIIPFLPDDRVVLFAEKAGGKKVMSWIDAPVGIPTKYGLQSKTWINTDPDVVFTRAQRLGLWALYNNQCFGVIDVG